MSSAEPSSRLCILRGVARAAAATSDSDGDDDDTAHPTPQQHQRRDAPTASDAPTAGEGIKLGIMAECEGAFGGFNEDVLAGVDAGDDQRGRRDVELAHHCTRGLQRRHGRWRCRSRWSASAAATTRPTASIQEIRKIVEQDGANVVIGPLSGDEGIAIANYAKDHPEVTFIDGIAGAQEATLQVQAPNYFRFHGDGAQWNAGLGDILHNDAGWDTVVVIADDYSFGWTSAAGFIADFCAVGGDVVAAGVPAAGHDRLLVVHRAAARPRRGRRLLLGRRRHRHPGVARGVRQRQG